MARTKQAVPKRQSESKTKVIKGIHKEINPGPPVKRPHRYRPGTVALREIRRYQKSTDRLLSRGSFRRLCREIAQDYKADLRFTEASLNALQCDAEEYLVKIFEAANELAIGVGKQQTVKPVAFKLAAKRAQEECERARQSCAGAGFGDYSNYDKKWVSDMEKRGSYSTAKSGGAAKPASSQAPSAPVLESAIEEDEEEDEAYEEEEEE